MVLREHHVCRRDGPDLGRNRHQLVPADHAVELFIAKRRVDAVADAPEARRHPAGERGGNRHTRWTSEKGRERHTDPRRGLVQEHWPRDHHSDGAPGPADHGGQRHQQHLDQDQRDRHAGLPVSEFWFLDPLPSRGLLKAKGIQPKSR